VTALTKSASRDWIGSALDTVLFLLLAVSTLANINTTNLLLFCIWCCSMRILRRLP
jgi:hypothetical protein